MDGHEQIWPAFNLLFYSRQFDVWFHDRIKAMHNGVASTRENIETANADPKNKYGTNVMKTVAEFRPVTLQYTAVCGLFVRICESGKINIKHSLPMDSREK